LGLAIARGDPLRRVDRTTRLDRLKSDPDYATKEFEKVRRVHRASRRLPVFAPMPSRRVSRRPRSGAAVRGGARQAKVLSPAQQTAAFPRSCRDTLFREQGLVADGILAIPVVLRPGAPARDSRNT
jgi:hypothetical protein